MLLSHTIPLYGLGALLSSYPQPEFEEELRAFLEQPVILDSAQPIEPESWEIVHQWLLRFQEAPETLNQLRSDYIDIFDRAHRENPLYETEFGRNRSVSKATELADLAGFYQAFGLESDGLPEMPDHVAVELEFYSYLLLKEQHLATLGDQNGCTVVQDARCKFLKQHLGSFIGAIGKCPGVQNHSFYQGLFAWLKALVEQECQHLGVQPDELDLYASERLSEEMGCGVLGGCQVGSMLK